MIDREKVDEILAMDVPEGTDIHATVKTVSQLLKHIEGMEEALDWTAYRYDRYAEAKTPIDAADALNQLNESMSDLKSWHSNYSDRTGNIERDED